MATTEDAMNEVGKLATDDPGHPVFILSETVEYEGVKTCRLDLDLDGLCGKDIIQAYREAMKENLGQQVPVPAMDKTCQAYVAAKAAKVPEGLIMKLKAKDFEKVTTAVMVFLLG